MSSLAVVKRGGSWLWPGPGRIYEVGLMMVVFLPVLYFRQSGFAMSVAAAMMILAAYVSAIFRKDLSVSDWGHLNRSTVWIIRIIAVSVGSWMFVEGPAGMYRYFAVFIYSALYAMCETGAWHRKRAAEAAASMR